MAGTTRRTKTLWVRDEYLGQILAGRKTIEVRVGYSNIVRLMPGDLLLLNDCHWYVIRRVARYDSVADLLQAEDPRAIAPDLPADRLADTIRDIYPPEKLALGLIALEIEPAR